MFQYYRFFYFITFKYIFVTFSILYIQIYYQTIINLRNDVLIDNSQIFHIYFCYLFIFNGLNIIHFDQFNQS